MRKQLETLIPDHIKSNLMLKAFAVTKVPLLFATGAYVKESNDQRCIIGMPFIKINKNHLGSLYFGSLAIGGEVCIGNLVVQKFYQNKNKMSFVFKSFNAQFLKRAEGPTEFICEAGDEIDELIEKVISSGERQTKTIRSVAKVDGEIVAEFDLELSIKSR